MIADNPCENASEPVSFDELCRRSQLSSSALMQLIEQEIAVPLGGAEPCEWVFSYVNMLSVKKAARLRRDLHLRWVDVSMVMQLLQQIAELEQENEHLHRRLERILT